MPLARLPCGVAIAGAILVTACASTQPRDTPEPDTFRASDGSLLASEREQFIKKRSKQLVRVESQIREIWDQAEETTYVDPFTRADWDESLQDLGFERHKLATELEVARQTSPSDWQRLRGTLAAAVEAARSTHANELCALSVPGAATLVEPAEDRVDVVVLADDETSIARVRGRAEQFTMKQTYEFDASQTGQARAAVPVRTWLEVIPQGVKVAFDPIDASQLPDLRAALERDARSVGTYACPLPGAPVL